MTTVVSDTSPINYLILIDEIEVLGSLFGEILIPPAVHRELLHPKANLSVSNWANNLPSWARVVAPSKIDSSVGLGAGETEAISLAEELHADLLLMDERLGRQAAKVRGIHTIGTLLILYQAGELRLLNFEQSIEKLRQTSFRMKGELVDALLEKARRRRKPV